MANQLGLPALRYALVVFFSFLTHTRYFPLYIGPIKTQELRVFSSVFPDDEITCCFGEFFTTKRTRKKANSEVCTRVIGYLDGDRGDM